jgi:tRNA 2-thiouridine synthesizing protein A
MLDDITPDEILDCRGLNCPMPILKTKKTIARMRSGEILEIQSTDLGTKNDLPGVASRAGHEYLGDRDEECFIRSYIKVK